MNVSGTPSSLQALLSQIEPATPAAPAPRGEPGQSAGQAAGQATPARQEAAAEPRVKIPDGATTLNPNAPRGTYLNLTV